MQSAVQDGDTGKLTDIAAMAEQFRQDANAFVVD